MRMLRGRAKFPCLHEISIDGTALLCQYEVHIDETSVLRVDLEDSTCEQPFRTIVPLIKALNHGTLEAEQRNFE